MRLLINRDVFLHLRLSFSFFLMPVYWFALSQTEHPDRGRALSVFIILHLLIYPASNAYNSYFDRDEGPIGGLEKPPPVDERLHRLAWALDAIALVLSWLLVDWVFALAMLVYGTISKAYSNDRIRLKKYPILSWLVIGLFQGGFTYLAILQAVDGLPLEALMSNHSLLPALLATLNLLGFYPMTQVYQHEEDARRGDLTMSRLVGIRGTFVLTGLIFVLATAGFYLFFQGKTALGLPLFGIYAVCMLPVVVFFLNWLRAVWRDPGLANFRSTMRLTVLGTLGLNVFFLFLLSVRVF